MFPNNLITNVETEREPECIVELPNQFSSSLPWLKQQQQHEQN